MRQKYGILISAAALLAALLFGKPSPKAEESVVREGMRREDTGVVIANLEKCWDGYMFYSSRDGEVSHLLDIDGTEVHRWSRIRGKTWHFSELLPNGHVIAVVKNESIFELDWDSQVIWEYETSAHHDYVRLPNGNTIVISRRRLTYPDVNPNASLLFDILLELTPENEIVWEWKVEEHALELAAMVGFTLPTSATGDWAHLNSIELLPDTPTATEDSRFKAGNLLLSLRNLDTICVIDPQSGSVLWEWGSGVLQRQHMPTMLENGNILIFDNGVDREYTKVVELDPLEEKIVWEYKSESDFYSSTRGGNIRLPNGNTFITESNDGRLFEVTPEGEIVWQFISTYENKGVFRAYRYSRDFVEGLLAKHNTVDWKAVVSDWILYH